LGQGILTFAYRSKFHDRITVDLSWAPGSFEWARASADFNENISGGTYYDANTPLGVRVDGVPDSVTTAPASFWQQISAASGTVIHTADVSQMQGTPLTYYRDNATIDPADTGDKKSYGEMGITVIKPINYIYLAVTHYILPPRQPNVGAIYHAYFSQPLQCQTNFTRVDGSGQTESPRSFFLSGNYPNPFNATTALRYGVSKTAEVDIAIYDVSGRKIRTLVRDKRTAGEFEVEWNGLNQMDRPAPSGIYLCVLTAAGFKMTQRLLLLR
jgi:hypothetical protein